MLRAVMGRAGCRRHGRRAAVRGAGAADRPVARERTLAARGDAAPLGRPGRSRDAVRARRSTPASAPAPRSWSPTPTGHRWRSGGQLGRGGPPHRGRRAPAPGGQLRLDRGGECLVHAEAARVAAAAGDRPHAEGSLVEAQLVRPLLSAALPWYAVHALLELARAYLAVDDATGAPRSPCARPRPSPACAPVSASSRTSWSTFAHRSRARPRSRDGRRPSPRQSSACFRSSPPTSRSRRSRSGWTSRATP